MSADPDDLDVAHSRRGAPESTTGRPADEIIAEFSRFYRDATPRLVAHLTMLGVPLGEAADSVQEAMIAALPPRWETLNQPYAWCRTVARRNAFRTLHRRESPVAEPEQEGSPLLPGRADFANFEARSDFLQILARLPPRQRAVLALTFDGATPAEIAADLEISQATVRAHLSQARHQIRKAHAEQALRDAVAADDTAR